MSRDRLSQLEKASCERLYLPERDVEWGTPFDATDAPILPQPLLSLGPEECPALADEALRARLALHEVASTFSAFVRFEAFLNERVARQIRAGDPVARETAYLLHIIEEEARHSRMFHMLVDRIGVGGYPRNGILGLVERVVVGALGRSALLFYLAMFAVEEITDRVIREVIESGSHPTLDQVCRIHRIEEARHMQFARDEIARRFAAAGCLHRWIAQASALPLALGIFEVLVSPSVYRRSGLAEDGPTQARLWWRGRRSARRRALRSRATRPYIGFLAGVGVVPAWLRAAWTRAGYTPPVSPDRA